MADTQTPESASSSQILFWIKFGTRVARRTPRPVGKFVAGAIALIMMVLGTERRHQVERNLYRILGKQFGYLRMRLLQAQTFVSYGWYWFEILHHRPNKHSLKEYFTGVGVENVDQALAEGKGLIMALPHLGNWDLAAAWFAELGYRPSAVAEVLKPEEVFEWFVSQRQAIGLEVIAYNPTAITHAKESLRKNQMLCLLCDRNLKGSGVETQFFSEPTALPGGPALIALQEAVPIIPVGIYRQRGGRFLVEFGSPIRVQREESESVRTTVTRVTQELTDRLEVIIRKAPQQWLMMQPNWPSDKAARPGGKV